MNRSQRPAPRPRTAQTLGFLVLVGSLVAASARAETITESEPNGSVITADHTLGPEPLSIVATLDPAADQDYFDFEVRTVGNGGVVRVHVDPGFSPYSFELVGPTGDPHGFVRRSRSARNGDRGRRARGVATTPRRELSV